MSTLRRLSGRLGPALLATALVSGAAAAGNPESLDATLTPYLSTFNLPALAAAVVVKGEVVAVGAVGTRRAGQHVPVTTGDRFHIGSDTKAMTALLAGMAVEDRRLRWSSTVGEAFPELADTINPKLAAVTLKQLLSHTSGVAVDSPEIVGLYEQAGTQDGNLDEMRLWLIRQWCEKPLSSEPGTAFAYSNLNYIIAGAMIERAYRTTWEELITERIFTPMGLESAGIGSQSSMGKVDAPLGHITIDGAPKAILAGPMCDGLAVVGPAGMAHMSIVDFARWAAWNAAEGARPPSLVKPETVRLLHAPVVSPPPRPDAAPGTPAKGDYALGWGRVTVDWAPAPLVHHAGSNSMNLAHIWVDPQNDVAIVLATNISNRKADEALFAIAPLLYGKYNR